MHCIDYLVIKFSLTNTIQFQHDSLSPYKRYIVTSLHRLHRYFFLVVVTIALSEANFKKGHKIYDRVHDCFDRLSHLTFDLLLSWIPPGMTAQTDNVSSFLQIIDVHVR